MADITMGTYINIEKIGNYWMPLDTLQCSRCTMIIYHCTICNKSFNHIAKHGCKDELSDFLLSFLSEDIEHNILTDEQIASHVTEKWTPTNNQQFLQSLHKDMQCMDTEATV